MAALTYDLYWKICIHTTEFENMGYSPDKIKESIKQAIDEFNNGNNICSVWYSGAYEITGLGLPNWDYIKPFLLDRIEWYITH